MLWCEEIVIPMLFWHEENVILMCWRNLLYYYSKQSVEYHRHIMRATCHHKTTACWSQWWDLFYDNWPSSLLPEDEWAFPRCPPILCFCKLRQLHIEQMHPYPPQHTNNKTIFKSNRWWRLILCSYPVADVFFILRCLLLAAVPFEDGSELSCSWSGRQRCRLSCFRRRWFHRSIIWWGRNLWIISLVGAKYVSHAEAMSEES